MNKLSLYVLFAAILPFLAGTLQGAEPECAQPGAGTSWTVTISRAKKQPAEARPADQEAAAEEKVDMPVLLSVQTGRNGISLGKITYKSGKTESFYAANGKVLVTA
ncbi:MAG TPA: hypothetical protein VK970_03590, partial [Candidatus Methylacidiphilales bacterium]|nr:hypothetical protein [Candidatus Methylacidiphilales bacterium]